MEMKPALLTVKEFAAYLHIGTTKAREILLSPSCTYCVRIGNRIFAHKEELNLWLKSQTKRR